MLRLPARRRRLAIKIGSLLVLLFAVAPQVLYLGRPLSEDQAVAAVQSMPPGHEHHAQAAAEHAGHCHVAPKGCATGGGAVQLASFDSFIQISTDGDAIAILEASPLLRAFSLWQRPEKPPQPA